MKDFAVVIGRMQPPHKGHIGLIRKATKIARRVVVLLGSAQESGTLKNPFHWSDRARVIEANFPRSKVICAPVCDYPADDKVWAINCVYAASGVFRQWHPTEWPSIVLVGHRKDASSYYLDLFPNWAYQEYRSVWGSLGSTDIRADYFGGMSVNKFSEKYDALLPYETYNLLADFRDGPVFRKISAKAHRQKNSSRQS